MYGSSSRNDLHLDKRYQYKDTVHSAFYLRPYFANRIIHGLCCSTLIKIDNDQQLVNMPNSDPSTEDYGNPIQLLTDWIETLIDHQTVEDKNIVPLGFLLLQNFHDYCQKTNHQHTPSESFKTLTTLRNKTAHALESRQVSPMMANDCGEINFNQHGFPNLRRHLKQIHQEITRSINPPKYPTMTHH
tara:strand:- start:172 stop:732 length:561 start_codon:yes stop_codon:yes gene_type:complete